GRLRRLLRLVSRDADYGSSGRGARRSRIKAHATVEQRARLVDPAQGDQDGGEIIERDRVESLGRRNGVYLPNRRGKIARAPSLPRRVDAGFDGGSGSRKLPHCRRIIDRPADL